MVRCGLTTVGSREGRTPLTKSRACPFNSRAPLNSRAFPVISRAPPLNSRAPPLISRAVAGTSCSRSIHTASQSLVTSISRLLRGHMQCQRRPAKACSPLLASKAPCLSRLSLRGSGSSCSISGAVAKLWVATWTFRLWLGPPAQLAGPGMLQVCCDLPSRCCLLPVSGLCTMSM